MECLVLCEKSTLPIISYDFSIWRSIRKVRETFHVNWVLFYKSTLEFNFEFTWMPFRTIWWVRKIEKSCFVIWVLTCSRKTKHNASARKVHILKALLKIFAGLTLSLLLTVRRKDCLNFLEEDSFSSKAFWRLIIVVKSSFA